MNPWERSELLLGTEGIARLQQIHIAVFGLGGVGSYATEGLARSGIGALTLIDGDCYDESNLNRQLYATLDTLGQKKVQAAAERISRVCPTCTITPQFLFYNTETAAQIDLGQFDFIIDAIDTVTSKLLLIEKAMIAGTPIISSMGTGNKLDPSRLQITDLSETQTCPLARILRRELRKRGILHLPVVFSDELSRKQTVQTPKASRHTPGSMVFVPAAAGMLMASYVIQILTKPKKEDNFHESIGY